MRTSRKSLVSSSSSSSPSRPPLFIEINKLLKENDIQNEISSKFFEDSTTTTTTSPSRQQQQQTENHANRVGNLLAEILVAELRRTKVNNDRVYRFMSSLLDHAYLDVNLVRNFLNQTILHTATENNDLNLCRLLVENGADYFGEDNYRQTPFILAAKRNFSAILRVFVDDVKRHRDEQIETNVSRQIRLATYHACYSGNFDIVRYLFEKFELTTEVLMHSRDDLELEWTSSLGKNKLKFSELNPLHVCCYKAYYDIVEYLLSRLDNRTNVAAIVNSPINEYRDSTSLEEAFKGRLLIKTN